MSEPKPITHVPSMPDTFDVWTDQGLLTVRKALLGGQNGGQPEWALVPVSFQPKDPDPRPKWMRGDDR